MLKKVLFTTFSIMSFSVILPTYANTDMSCKIQVAVSTPPITFDQNVAFNVTNQLGLSKSITLNGGSSPQYIEKLPCISEPLTISATVYSTPVNGWLQGPAIGQCILKAGPVVLNGPENSVSVVFPYDFNCNY
ncbi:hypothetical protein [Legionella longbeachae]|uniref:Uncharacterized protein n=1 Tax=Legionella longbeachae serogroup 1 (strain NSW150) TaxID=661367 RepID=D3HK90_LEGLN|nr:hypothetical protein [Legionella longbeachae]VEE03370.1 Uncharacterised protein [Legionella oakridgensis]HBD7397647.1 hypothetical protein [Legionella pneumophila]ARB93735.1 hypothetical protein A6J40_16815 [Legionella longbeachae]ARM33125.1 hypothetical protein B0B39_06150 [Legionella longbeachae]EEZ94029.1 conserved hypothetical protein [Legionella longbeachae D-4968]